MSPLVILGSLGTFLTTTSMLPHLVHALRHRRPSGSATGWGVGAASATVWFMYGVDRHDLIQAAPGFVTVPIGAFLSGWCLLAAHRARRARQAVSVGALTKLPEPALVDPLEEMFQAPAANVRDPGDTLELPRVVA